MAKHTQTIRRLLLTNCLRVFDHFVGLALKGFNIFASSARLFNVCCINPFMTEANQWTGFYMISASVMKGLNDSLVAFACYNFMYPHCTYFTNNPHSIWQKGRWSQKRQSVIFFFYFRGFYKS